MNLSNSSYVDKRSLNQKIYLFYWRVLWSFLNNAFPLAPGFILRRVLLRIHGAKIGKGTRIYGGVKIYNPSNLVIGRSVTVGRGVNLYSVSSIVIGDGSVLSQKCELLTASHDFRSQDFRLVTKPVSIGKNVWLSQDVVVGPGVDITENTVVGIRGLVVKSIEVSGIYVAPKVTKL
jgi:putative colanic acid biosynthesis acetyltransferase WcaF